MAAGCSTNSTVNPYRATQFVKYGKHQRKIALRLLTEHYDLFSSMQFPAYVLDANCSTGEMTKVLSYHPNFAHVLGIDMSSEMVALADLFNVDTRISYAHADIQTYSSLPQSPRCHKRFDLIVANDLLHWLNQPAKALQCMLTCLNDGGFLMATITASRQMQHPAFRHFIHTSRWKVYEKALDNTTASRPQAPWFDDEEPHMTLGDYLTLLGYDVMRCTLEDDIILLNREEALGTLRMQSLYSSVIPAHELPDFYEESAEAYLRNFVLTKTGFYMKNEKIVVILARRPLN